MKILVIKSRKSIWIGCDRVDHHDWSNSTFDGPDTSWTHNARSQSKVKDDEPQRLSTKFHHSSTEKSEYTHWESFIFDFFSTLSPTQIIDVQQIEYIFYPNRLRALSTYRQMSSEYNWKYIKEYY